MIMPLIAMMAAVLTACGPSKSQLQARLNQVETEMCQLEMKAQAQRSLMNDAEFASFIGGFAVGFGLVTDNGGLASQGGGAIDEANSQSNNARATLEQIRSRYNTLAAQREELLMKLR